MIPTSSEKSTAAKICPQRQSDFVKLPGLTAGMAHGKAPAHAFRHWFTTAARRWGVDSEKREAILGHRLPGEQGTYGDMAGLAAEMRKLPDPLALVDSRKSRN